LWRACSGPALRCTLKFSCFVISSPWQTIWWKEHGRRRKVLRNHGDGIASIDMFTDIDPTDLGPLLGRSLRQEFYKRFPDDWLVVPREGIRATVIGACQFTLQASGYSPRSMRTRSR
jgi:hypothetical protein